MAPLLVLPDRDSCHHALWTPSTLEQEHQPGPWLASPSLEGKDSFTTWFRVSWHSGEGLIPVLIHAAVIWFKPSWPSREVGPWLRFPGSEQGDSGHTWTTAGTTAPKTPLLLCYLLGSCCCLGAWDELFQDALWTRSLQRSCMFREECGTRTFRLKLSPG